MPTFWTNSSVSFPTSLMSAMPCLRQLSLGSDGVPAYLLPAEASLYSKPDLLRSAHLYPALKSIIENSVVPSELGLNEELRNLGRVVDDELSKP